MAKLNELWVLFYAVDCPQKKNMSAIGNLQEKKVYLCNEKPIRHGDNETPENDCAIVSCCFYAGLL